jgi:hypothetical protein
MKINTPPKILLAVAFCAMTVLWGVGTDAYGQSSSKSVLAAPAHASKHDDKQDQRRPRLARRFIAGKPVNENVLSRSDG